MGYDLMTYLWAFGKEMKIIRYEESIRTIFQEFSRKKTAIISISTSQSEIIILFNQNTVDENV